MPYKFNIFKAPLTAYLAAPLILAVLLLASVFTLTSCSVSKDGLVDPSGQVIKLQSLQSQSIKVVNSLTPEQLEAILALPSTQVIVSDKADKTTP